MLKVAMHLIKALVRERAKEKVAFNRTEDTAISVSKLCQS